MKSFIPFLLLLFSFSTARADTANLDRYENEDFAYALVCSDGIYSSVRHRWQQGGRKIDISSTSLYQVIERVQARASEYDAQAAKSALSMLQDQIQWRSDIEFNGDALGLPKTIDGCRVEALWAYFALPGQSYKMRIGRAPLLEQMNPTDILLLGLPVPFRKSNANLRFFLSSPTPSAHMIDWYQKLSSTQNPVLAVEGGKAQGCRLDLDKQILICQEAVLNELMAPLSWRRSTKCGDEERPITQYYRAKFSSDGVIIETALVAYMPPGIWDERKCKLPRDFNNLDYLWFRQQRRYLTPSEKEDASSTDQVKLP